MAEEKELTDSQLLDVARQLEQELKFKQNAAIGLRQYVRIKQDLKSKAQELADLNKEITAKKKELEKIGLAAAQKVQNLGADFDAMKAEKERDLQYAVANHNQEMEKLKKAAEAAKIEDDTARASMRTAAITAAAEHSKKMKAFKVQEDEKVASIEGLERQYNDLKVRLNQLKADHGL